MRIDWKTLGCKFSWKKTALASNYWSNGVRKEMPRRIKRGEISGLRDEKRIRQKMNITMGWLLGCIYIPELRGNLTNTGQTIPRRGIFVGGVISTEMGGPER